MKNMTKNFTQKVYTEEIDDAKEILNIVFYTIDFDTIEYAKEKTKKHFIHANDYIFEKVNIWSNNKLNINNIPLIIEGQVEQNFFRY